MNPRLALMLLFALTAMTRVDSQGRQGAAPQPQSPRQAAPVDFTGTWVAVITEDWRYRMMTPRKGDYMSVPLSAEGRKVADAWDPATAGSCLAHGAGGLMRLPTRLRVSWEDDRTLRMDADAGQQTRRFHFAPAPPPGRRSLQGHSVAEWDAPGGMPAGVPVPSRPFGLFGPAGAGETLKVVTTNLTAGWLRPNGVPYSEQTTITEYYTRFTAPGGDEWFVVTTAIVDPRFLSGEFLTSTHFKREATGDKWDPVPCRTF
jgi:hypothetical protein